MLKGKLKLFSFFSGSGILDLGFETTGYNVIYINEVYKPFLDAYKYSRNAMKIKNYIYEYNEGDIAELLSRKQKIKLRQIIKEQRCKSNFIGFIGGPPCPDFSIGGKNRGCNGDKGKLSATYIELICQLLPDFFLFENVKGLWQTKKHREFYENIKKELHSNGYVTSERLINAIEFGVPQDRDRIILVGFRKNFLREIGKKVKRGCVDLQDFPWVNFIKYPKETIREYPWPDTDPFVEDSILKLNVEVPLELTVKQWFEENNVLNHPNAGDYFKPKAGLKKFRTIDEGDDSKKSFKRLHRWRYSPTAAYGNNEVHLHPYKARRLTVAEALAIQSLPANFILPVEMTLTDKFKTIGNGVPYLAAKSLAETIYFYLEQDLKIE